MAGLCEGGNEPTGSLTAINKLKARVHPRERSCNNEVKGEGRLDSRLVQGKVENYVMFLLDTTTQNRLAELGDNCGVTSFAPSFHARVIDLKELKQHTLAMKEAHIGNEGGAYEKKEEAHIGNEGGAYEKKEEAHIGNEGEKEEAHIGNEGGAYEKKEEAHIGNEGGAYEKRKRHTLAMKEVHMRKRKSHTLAMKEVHMRKEVGIHWE
ncbi:hypothetical protein ANN_09836 [Periplaneta americana]|uniref:Uncharacterized protein n=1 Tax=Periplaneta americana TaxID=6978 RepID=A0ABQ8TPP4_PERAM|nr:hypothetical protein ANN_09836 [Periplaneta americana]